MPRYSNPSALGAPYGLYSHMAHCEGGPLHFVAGQLAIQEDGSVVGKNDLHAQLAEVLNRISAAAASVGLGLENVVQFTTFLAGRELVPDFYKAREKLFAQLYPEGNYPPNTLIAVAGLVEPDLLVEIQAVLAP